MSHVSSQTNHNLHEKMPHFNWPGLSMIYSLGLRLEKFPCKKIRCTFRSRKSEKGIGKMITYKLLVLSSFLEKWDDFRTHPNSMSLIHPFTHSLNEYLLGACSAPSSRQAYWGTSRIFQIPLCIFSMHWSHMEASSHIKKQMHSHGTFLKTHAPKAQFSHSELHKSGFHGDQVTISFWAIVKRGFMMVVCMTQPYARVGEIPWLAYFDVCNDDKESYTTPQERNNKKTLPNLSVNCLWK